jgi:hypothetical protein
MCSDTQMVGGNSKGAARAVVGLLSDVQPDRGRVSALGSTILKGRFQIETGFFHARSPSESGRRQNIEDDRRHRIKNDQLEARASCSPCHGRCSEDQNYQREDATRPTGRQRFIGWKNMFPRTTSEG